MSDVAPSAGLMMAEDRRRHRFWQSWVGPGSVLWLMRYDLLLAGRGVRESGAREGAVAAGVMGVMLIVLHVTGFAAAPLLSALHDRFRRDFLLVGSIVLACAFTLFLSKAIAAAADALYQRGDLDLLMSSPLPMRRVLAARLLAIAVIAGFMPILLILPIANGMILRGYFAWFGVYPVIASLCLMAAAMGGAMTFGLLAWVGPRWTAFISRALATLFGIASFLLAQVRFLVPDETRTTLWKAMLPSVGHGPLGLGWWPARALMGETLPMLALVSISILAVMGVSTALGQAYGTGVLGRLSAVRDTRESSMAQRFRGGPFAALVRKELRLMLRQPGLGTQLVYQFVFLVPGVIAMLRFGEASGLRSPAGVAFLTAMMSGRIARIIAAGPFEGDEAAALAATAPVAGGSVIRAKLLVTGAILAVIIGGSLFGVWLQRPAVLPAAAVASVAAAFTRIRLAMSRPRVLRRAGLQGRIPEHAGGIVGGMIDIAWGICGAAIFIVF